MKTIYVVRRWGPGPGPGQVKRNPVNASHGQGSLLPLGTHSLTGQAKIDSVHPGLISRPIISTEPRTGTAGPLPWFVPAALYGGVVLLALSVGAVLWRYL